MMKIKFEYSPNMPIVIIYFIFGIALSYTGNYIASVLCALMLWSFWIFELDDKIIKLGNEISEINREIISKQESFITKLVEDKRVLREIIRACHKRSEK